MNVPIADPAALARDLLRCPSVTPADGGALGVIENVLKPVGFDVHRVTFAEPGTAPVENLYARIGGGRARISSSPATPTWCRRASKRHGLTRRLRARSPTARSMAAALSI